MQQEEQKLKGHSGEYNARGGGSIHWSRFVCMEELDGTSYLVNTLTRAVAAVSANIKEVFERNSFIPRSEREKVILQEMIEHMFVVDDDFDETALFRYFVNKLKYTTNEAGMDITLLVTYACNMLCNYCYENGVKEFKGTVLDERTCELIIPWIEGFAARKKVKEVAVDFYGGEPLLNPRIMKYYMRRSNEIGRMKYLFTATTNGTLLTKSLLEELKPLGFCGAQITLDGPRAVHDSRRRFRNGGGTFDLIFSNLLNSVDEIDIGLSINTDRHNCKDVPAFLDILDEHGLKDKIVLAFNLVQRAPKRQEHCIKYLFSDTELSEAQVELYKCAVEKGFSVEHRIVSGVCRCQHEYSIVIDPVGDIYPCPATVGIDAFFTANVRDSLSDFYRRWGAIVGMEPWNNEQCLQCPYVPICLGGCRHQTYTSLGNRKGRFCRRESFRGDAKIMILRAEHETSSGAKI